MIRRLFGPLLLEVIAYGFALMLASLYAAPARAGRTRVFTRPGALAAAP